MTECICAFLPHRWDCPQSGRPTYEELEARLEAVKALCDEAIAGEHADSEATCAVCLAQDVLRAAEGKP